MLIWSLGGEHRRGGPVGGGPADRRQSQHLRTRDAAISRQCNEMRAQNGPTHSRLRIFFTSSISAALTSWLASAFAIRAIHFSVIRDASAMPIRMARARSTDSDIPDSSAANISQLRVWKTPIATFGASA